MFLSIARNGKNSWWRYLLTIIGVIIGYTLGQMPLYFAILWINGGMMDAHTTEMLEALDFEGLGLSPNFSLFLMLLSFVGAMLMLWVFVPGLHNRSFKTLITPFEKIQWSKIFFAFGIWMILTFLMEGLNFLLNPEVYRLQFDFSQFLLLVVICIFVLPVQTSFEELFFRGYLMQGIGLIGKYKLIPLVITSFLFGMMHILNPEVEQFGAGIMMTYYIGVGLFLGFITLMDDSLELALGIHYATNFYAATFITYEGSALKTNAIFQTQIVNIEIMLLFFLVSALVFTFVCFKKYNWNRWGKGIGKIEDRFHINT